MTASFADQEIWHVLVASDDMKRMNVDQLDDAFRLDIVDASTLVWKAGMRTWQRLGSLAGIEDEPETITKQMTPETLAQLMPMHPPPPAPRPRSIAPKPPRPAQVPAFKTQQFAAPLVAAPMYVPQLYAPDPYVLPKRRANLPSEVDFRRRSGGVRLGRWLVGLLIVTTGFLVCYRQNLLREGARRVGIENKYLYGEKRALAFVTTKAPRSVQNVMTRLALLPGPNAAALTMKAPAPRAPEPVAAAAPAAPQAEAAKAPSNADSDVKTVSLDSLPVLGSEPATESAQAKSVASPAPAAKAAAPRAAAVASKPAVKAQRVAKAQERDDDEDEAPAPKAKAKKAEPKPEPEPKVAKQAPPPPPSGNESFLKAAIRSAIAADKGK